jgi:sialic acid synthase SpsE
MSTTIIAEAGVNHNGSMDLARDLIEVAAQAGVRSEERRVGKECRL